MICASLIAIAAQYGNIDCLGLLKVGTISKLDTGTAVYLESVYFAGGQIGAPTDRPNAYITNIDISGTVTGIDKSDVELNNVPNTDCTNASNITTGTLPKDQLPYYTANRAAIFNAAGALTESDTTDSEIAFVHGVTSAIQTQLDAKSTKLTANATVNFTYDMTAAQIQALIDAQPKNLGGKTLTFQFGDGTYNTSMTSALAFQYFYNGNLRIYGNTGEADATALHTSQSVYLDFSAGTSHGIYVSDCFCYVYIRNIKVKVADAGIKAIYLLKTSTATINYCYVLGAAKTAINYGIACQQGVAAEINKNYVSNLNTGILALSSIIFSNGNDDTGTAPNYGLNSQQAGTIGKNSTQPDGTTANEYTATGGVIR